jgi:hypothetical protein
MLNPKTGERYITAIKLIDIIYEFPSKSRITSNAVGSLMVESEDGRYIGYINIGAETAEKLDDTR